MSLDIFLLIGAIFGIPISSYLLFEEVDHLDDFTLPASKRIGSGCIIFISFLVLTISMAYVALL